MNDESRSWDQDLETVAKLAKKIEKAPRLWKFHLRRASPNYPFLLFFPSQKSDFLDLTDSLP